MWVATHGQPGTESFVLGAASPSYFEDCAAT